MKQAKNRETALNSDGFSRCFALPKINSRQAAKTAKPNARNTPGLSKFITVMPVLSILKAMLPST
ncbi:MAG: hypothetical protein ACT4O9_05695 [Blastocatellia bacterium]